MAVILRVVLLVIHSVLLMEAVLTKDYCIVGAGPAGLQLGSFLQTAQRDYIIFERANGAGNFFIKYPRHGKLISINKRHTGKTNDEFNMRHDWNSLLTENLSLRMTRYSKEFFPPKASIVKYLNDFAEHYKLHIQYNTNISDITPSPQPGGMVTLHDQNANVYQCKVLVMATGYSKEKLMTFPGSEYTTSYGDISINPDDFEGKSVLILGRGNSGFETADSMMGATNVVHLLGRSRVKLSWETHYVGDLRAVNNGILDTYQLKSLDGLVEAPIAVMNLIKTKEGKIRLNLTEDLDYDNFALRDDYDVVISCLGFMYDFSIFNQSATVPEPHKKFKKFPAIFDNYESVQSPGVYFAGTSTHSLDFKRSAGGFIHGFRYTTRSLFNLLEWKYHGIKWPTVTVPWLDMQNTIVKRINEASGTYQMFGVLGDVILIDDVKQTFVMLEEFPIKLIAELYKHSGHNHTRAIVMLFEYGKDFSGPGKDIFRTSRATGEPAEAHISNFLHPTFYYYKTLPTDAEMLDVKIPEILPKPDRLHHIVEDFLTEFDGPVTHLLPLRRYLETCLDTDLRYWLADKCFEFALTHTTLPLDCQQNYMNNRGINFVTSSI